ncbi:MAG: porin [bacterium]|nr:porin [bacterium]
MKRFSIVLSFLLLVNVVGAGLAFADANDVEDLLHLLLERDVVSDSDAQSFKKQLAEKKSAKKGNEFFLVGNNPVKISGYLNLRYRQAENISNGFDIRRARLDIRGDIAEKWNYRFQSDFKGPSAKVLDIYAGYKAHPAFNITLGQQKIPFSLENLESNPRLKTINRSQVVEALVARGKDVIGNQSGRDIGLKLGGALETDDWGKLLNYAVGIFNGTGINASDDNNQQDYVGRVVLTPVKHFSIGASGYAGRYVASGSLADRKRSGIEAKYDNKTFALSGEYIAGKDGTTEKEGWYLQGSYYVIPSTLEAVLKYDRWDPDTKVSNNRRDVSTVGANLHFNKNVFVQANYEFKEEQGTKIKNDTATVQLTARF